MILTEKDFLKLAARRRLAAVVVQHQLDPAKRHGVIDHHALVQMPSFERAGQDHGKIDFAKLAEVRITAPQLLMRRGFVGL